MERQEEVAPRGLYELLEDVREWGRDRNISNPTKQTVKAMEELGEVASEISREHFTSEELKDGIGDTLVTLIILADILGMKAEDCLAYAYEQIKNRKGTTLNGSFVKESDLDSEEDWDEFRNLVSNGARVQSYEK